MLRFRFALVEIQRRLERPPRVRHPGFHSHEHVRDGAEPVASAVFFVIERHLGRLRRDEHVAVDGDGRAEPIVVPRVLGLEPVQQHELGGSISRGRAREHEHSAYVLAVHITLDLIAVRGLVPLRRARDHHVAVHGDGEAKVIMLQARRALQLLAERPERRRDARGRAREHVRGPRVRLDAVRLGLRRAYHQRVPIQVQRPREIVAGSAIRGAHDLDERPR